MKTLEFGEAIDDALAFAMAADERIVVWGEDVQSIHLGLFIRFGEQRVRNTPISEAAFLGAGVTAALAGLRPVVDIMLVDFLGVAMDALFNHAAKVEAFSGGRWKAPLVVRTACGGGYGDAGQHEQSLWGWIAHIPGLAVVVPSTPADAGGLMLGALEYGSPVVFMEHKLISQSWLDFLGRGGRKTMQFSVPEAGVRGPVPSEWHPCPIGQAAIRRQGKDVTLTGVAVGVHRALQAAEVLSGEGIEAEVIDLRSLVPLDRASVLESLRKTGRLLVVDEDYASFGLSGELAALALEAGLVVRFGRVAVRETIPYSRTLEEAILPTVASIVQGSRELCR